MQHTIRDYIASEVTTLRAGGPGSGRRPEGGRQAPPAGIGDRRYWQGSGGSFAGIYHHTSGDSRPYHIVEGIGPHGGQWAAVEAKSKSGPRELVSFGSQKEAEEHVDLSQRD